MDYLDKIAEWRREAGSIVGGFARVYPADVEISRSRDGRTVEAYAAVFDSAYEVKDQHGHYMESISRSAFDRALSGGRLPLVLWNHGRDLSGRPSALAEVPLGTCLECRPDGKGLFTVSRYNRTELADSVLEAIKAGNITSQSFRGQIVRSTPDRVPRVRQGEQLPTITRTELGLSDYGPTPVPANASAKILAVRSSGADYEDYEDYDEDPPIRTMADLRRKIRLAKAEMDMVITRTGGRRHSPAGDHAERTWLSASPHPTNWASRPSGHWTDQ